MVKNYVADNEYEGAFVGTLEQILENMIEEDWLLGNTTFYELGSEVKLELAEA